MAREVRFSVHPYIDMDRLDWDKVSRVAEKYMTEAIAQELGRGKYVAVIPAGADWSQYDEEEFGYKVYYEAEVEVFDRTGRNVAGRGWIAMDIICLEYDEGRDEFVDCGIDTIDGEAVIG